MSRSRLRYAKHPERLDAPRYMVIEDMVRLHQMGKRGCVRKMIQMCRDLDERGMTTRYRKHLGGPIHELKDRTAEGGARVYFFRGRTPAGKEEFVLVHAECKKENAADAKLLNDGADVIELTEQTVPLACSAGRRDRSDSA